MKKSKMLIYNAGIALLGLLAVAAFAFDPGADTDADGMTDGYELFFGLNHTNALDALADTDGDSVTNLQEALLWTDPLFADTDRDGWPDNIDANPLSRAVFLWSNPKFAAGTSYLYTGPAWWGGAFRDGGLWTTNGWEAGSGLSNNTGALNIQVLREFLTNNVVLDVELFDAPNASLYASLCDSNQTVIINDLYGNIVTGSQAVVTRRLTIPFASCSNASIIRLWRGTGDITVYSSLMYIDEDGDGLDADQELQAGTLDSDADSDNDGLNDFAELMLTHTDPLVADTDGDGYSDQAETVAASDPNDAQSLPQYAMYSVPFTETFEAVAGMAGIPGDLNGQHGWAATGEAIVQSESVYAGAQALSVTDATVSHEFTDGQTNVWVSYQVKAVRGSAPQNIPTNMAVVFYVNSAGNLCVYSNQQSVTLPVIVPDGWSRFDIHSDFTSKRWDMRLNRHPVVNGFPFYGSPNAFTVLRFDGKGTCVDDIQVVFENPDRDGDGYTNDEETQGGSNPDDAQSLPPVTVSGQIAYSGSATGAIHVVAVAVSNDWNSTVSTALTVPGSYSLANVPALTDIWVKVWLDSDSNGLCDPWEAQGSYVSNPLCLRSPVSAVNLTLTVADEDGDGLNAAQEHAAGTSDTDADSDDDGLSDYEEVVQTLSNPLAADTDADGINDFDEVRIHGTSPLSADTDHDSLPDIWEITNGLCPTNFADCMSDPDGDGFGTVYEVHHGTSWTNGAEYPAATTNVIAGQKIQDVINAAADYAIIRIEPGTYSGSKNRDLHFNGKPMMLIADAGTVTLDVGLAVAVRAHSDGCDIRTVVDGLIVRNASQQAFFFTSTGLTLRNCVIENNGNGSVSGAGLYISASTTLVENCVFAGNVSSNGGAIYASNADLELRNCTLVSNRVTGASGSIRFGGTGKTLTVLNSIIWEEGTNPVHMVSGTSTVSYSCIKGGYAGTGNLSDDPQVLGNGYHLNPGSPCIDAGTASGAPAADIAGHGRTGNVDIGAWEYNASYADSDSDGYTDASETGISDPQDADSLPVSEVTVSGNVSYTGIQTGSVYVAAITDSNDWNSSAAVQSAGTGSYSITNVPVLTNVWIKAWVDSNGNGIREASEACGETGPLFLRVPATANVSLTDPDSDGDGLSDVIEMNGRIYLVIPGSFTWQEARADAEKLGGHLAVITSELEHRILTQYIGEQTFNNGIFWIGAENLESDGVWRWITGEAFAYTRWGDGYPFNVTGAAMYDHSAGVGMWLNRNTISRRAYLLEYTAVLNPFSADSDGDGLNDLAEIRTGSNPALADTDGDGLQDYDEVHTHGTSPCKADTDGDGLSDSGEINTHGTNPLNPDTDGDGLSDGVETASCSYQVVFEYMKWPEAKAHAEALGGRLAVIDSETKQQEIERFLVGGGYPSGLEFFIGLTGDAQRDRWSWVTDDVLGYAHWSDDYPTVNSDGKYAGIRAKTSYGWIDVGSTEYRPALIEFADNQLDPLNPDSDGDGIPDGEEISKGMNPCGLDSDGDGLSDAYEVSAGLNGGVADSDSDGLTDPVELSLGTNPLSFDSDGDTLLDGEEVSSTLTDPLTVSDVAVVSSVPGVQTVDRFRSHAMVEFIDDGDDLIIKTLIDWPTITYSMNVATANMYRLTIQMEPEEEVSSDYLRYPIEISINGNVIGEMLAVTNRGDVAEGFIYTPWLVPGTYKVECRFNRFTRSTRDVRIHALELSTVEGVDANSNGIADWIDSRMGATVDTDGDGLSDHAEIFTYGTDSLNADTDGDGLKDGAELVAGTNLLDADSDDDGVTDGVEVNEIHTDALAPKFDGTVVDLLTLPGFATNSVTGSWTAEGTELRSESRRGEVEYKIMLPVRDIIRLTINATHLWEDRSCTPMLPVDTSHLQISVDGIYVGSYPLVAADGVYVGVQAFLPALPAGEHTVRIFWENTSGRLALKIRELKLQQLGGPDANSDGVKDWVAKSLYNSTSVDSPLQSVVSPICLEGVARYVELARISNIEQGISNAEVEQGAGARWFVNTPLNANGQTPVAVSFQSGAFTRTVQTEWVPFNMLQNSQTNLTIRAGSSVKLTALPQGWHGGQFTLTLNGQETRSPNCHPLIYAFDQPGAYVITGEYRKGNQTTTGQLTVTVVGWEFSGEAPACMVGQQREWTVNLPQGAVLETDSTIEMAVLDVSPATNNQQRTTLSLKASSANGEHVAVVRLCPGGAILDSAKLNPFWVQNASDGYFKVVERYEDSELWEVNSIVKNLPETVDMQIKVIIGGVTLDDYTLERWITNAAYDATGQYNFRLFHPNSVNFSVCHTFKVYQDGEFIGEAFGGGWDDIGKK
jgi:predicted outer membrane repeat protein